MSIKGIENQIMMARTAEVSQNQSLQNARRGELNQNQVAVQGQAQDAQETRTVARTEEGERVELRQDEGGAGGGAQGDSRRRGKEPPAEEELDLPAGYGQARHIDIKV